MNLKLKSLGSYVERCKCFRDDRNHWQKNASFATLRNIFCFFKGRMKKTWSLFGIIVGLTNKGEQTSIQGFFDTTFLSHLISVAAAAVGVSACQETLKATISIVNVFLSPMVLRNYLRGPIDLEYEKSEVVINPSISLLTLHIPKHSFYINLESNYLCKEAETG